MADDATSAAAAAAASTYKQLKEDFVSNLTGGTATEVNLVTAVAPVSVLVWSVLQARSNFFAPYSALGFTVDFLLNAVSILLATTAHSSHPVQLCSILLAFGVAAYFLRDEPRPRKKAIKPPSSSTTMTTTTTTTTTKEKHAPSSPQNTPREWTVPVKAFITTYRGTMMAITCAAILAVDFPIFPRRFAKAETWGTSLMDMGVGSFVFAAGIVSARPLLKERFARGSNSTPQSASSEPSSSVVARVVSSMRHSLPLLVLGIIRLVSVKGLDYAEHVTEYGVHWNFFFTLACLPPFVTACQPLLLQLPSPPLFSAPGTLAVVLAAAYQAVLDKTALKAFILTAPRIDLLSKNREGVFSIVGYLAIFLAGQDAGIWALPLPRLADGAAVASYRFGLVSRLALKAAAWIGLYMVVTDLTYGFNMTVSRRLSNLPYVIWVAAFNTTQLLAFAAIDAIFFPPAPAPNAAVSNPRAEKELHDRATSRVLRAFNRNGLVIFLLANLLTGLVNLTVPTLHVGVSVSMYILTGYMFVLTSVAMLLDHLDVSIKL